MFIEYSFTLDKAFSNFLWCLLVTLFRAVRRWFNWRSNGSKHFSMFSLFPLLSCALPKLRFMYAANCFEDRWFSLWKNKVYVSNFSFPEPLGLPLLYKLCSISLGIVEFDDIRVAYVIIIFKFSASRSEREFVRIYPNSIHYKLTIHWWIDSIHHLSCSII